MNRPDTVPSIPAPTRYAVNGVELEVLEAGREHAGNAIVLCHGWPDVAATWHNQLQPIADAGFHVIAPTQRGFGRSSRPDAVEAYGIEELTGDLVGLLDHLGIQDATFVGHDWGANVVWGLAQLHPERARRLINLSLPYQPRGETPWLQMLEQLAGPEFYMVDFDRRPGVATAVLEANVERFLRNLYRRDEPAPTGPPPSGNAMIALALHDEPQGTPLLSDDELALLVDAFTASGFEGGAAWYRNLDRNWHTLADVDPVVHQPTLMIFGERDPASQPGEMASFVPDLEVAWLDAGHWIHRERPTATTGVILDWLRRNP